MVTVEKEKEKNLGTLGNSKTSQPSSILKRTTHARQKRPDRRKPDLKGRQRFARAGRAWGCDQSETSVLVVPAAYRCVEPVYVWSPLDVD